MESYSPAQESVPCWAFTRTCTLNPDNKQCLVVHPYAACLWDGNGSVIFVWPLKLCQCQAGVVTKSTCRFDFDHSWRGEDTMWEDLCPLPVRLRSHALSVCVYLQVISGSNLPVPRSGKALDPFVRVEIHGIPSDSCKTSTHAVKNNCKHNSLCLEVK